MVHQVPITLDIRSRSSLRWCSTVSSKIPLKVLFKVRSGKIEWKEWIEVENASLLEFLHVLDDIQSIIQSEIDARNISKSLSSESALAPKTGRKSKSK